MKKILVLLILSLLVLSVAGCTAVQIHWKILPMKRGRSLDSGRVFGRALSPDYMGDFIVFGNYQCL